MCLEGFQSGLSWLTILRKRENFRRAFAGFDRRGRALRRRDVEGLLGDAGIVRHRGKIEAAIANARATLLREAGTPLHELVWSYRATTPGRGASTAGIRRPRARASSRSACARRAIASSGRRRLLEMQACGVVNDHLLDCHVRDAVEAERRDGSRRRVAAGYARRARRPRSRRARRLEAEDAASGRAGPAERARARQVARTTGQFLFSLVAPQTDCEVLEIGGSRGYSTIWLAAGVRYLGGRVLSLEHDPPSARPGGATSPRPGSRRGPSCSRATPSRRCREIDDVFDVVFLDAEKDDYERLFALARDEGRAGRGRRRRQRALARRDPRRVLERRARPTRRSSRVTVPLDRGLELSVVLSANPRFADGPLGATAERRWSGRDRFKYGQWRYQRVGACPRDLRGIA